ncbi:DUF2599 domain-containing protein [Nocardia sp. NPDC004151]|uniref:DUF2599 domain-containing protein n=1 Tax=Nocardia sp. NPDC004151 TaxID=3364304 RepID=UPI0036B4B104
MPMRRRWKLAGGPPVLALALVLTGCGAAEDSPPVVVSSLGPISATVAPVQPVPTANASAPTTATAISSAATPAVDPMADQALIDHTEWTDEIDGRRLKVFPTRAGRIDLFPTAGDRAWGEVLALAPDADSPGMFDQFRCHWEWARAVAPDKASWNLEPWRPAVGYDATVSALCNPGGPER